jgi:hypothetical protein
VLFITFPLVHGDLTRIANSEGDTIDVLLLIINDFVQQRAELRFTNVVMPLAEQIAPSIWFSY